jgi:O-methyltransferase
VKAWLLVNRAASPAHLKLVPANLLGEEWFSQCCYFARLLERVDDVGGDVVECGVATGKSFALLAALIRSSGRQRTLWGFDSWSGLPPPSSEDEGSARGEGAFSDASLNEVKLRLAQFDVHELDRIRLVQGRLEETLSAASIERVAFAHLDVDLYDSYRLCLENLWPKLQPGGIMALDEYAHPDWPGATKAVDEFLATLPAGEAKLESDPRFHDRHYITRVAP